MALVRRHSHALLSVLGNGLSGLGGLGAVVLYARALPEDAFGIYYGAFAISALASIAASGGLPDFAIKSIAEDERIGQGIGRHAARFWIPMTLVATILTAAAMVHLLDGNLWGLMLALSVLVRAPLDIAIAVLRINTRFAAVALALAGDNLIRCALGVLMILFDWDFNQLCQATGATLVLLAIPVWVWLWRSGRSTERLQATGTVIKGCTPYLAGNVVGCARNNLDVVVVGFMLGPTETAVFVASVLFARRSRLIGVAIADIALLPRLMRTARESQSAFRASAFALTFKLIGLGILIAGCVALAGDPLLRFMGYEEAKALYYAAAALIPMRFGVLALSSALKYGPMAVGRLGDHSAALVALLLAMALLIGPMGLWGVFLALAVSDTLLLSLFALRLARTSRHLEIT